MLWDPGIASSMPAQISPVRNLVRPEAGGEGGRYVWKIHPSVRRRLRLRVKRKSLFGQKKHKKSRVHVSAASADVVLSIAVNQRIDSFPKKEAAMKKITRQFGERKKRDGRRASRARLALETLENRTMMTGAIAGADAIADMFDGTVNRGYEPGCQSAYVDQQAALGQQVEVTARSSSQDNPVGIAPLPSPHPRPDYAMGMSSSAHESVDRVGIAPLPTPHPRPEAAGERVSIDPLPTPHPRPEELVSDALATAWSQRHAGNANDYVMGMGWSAHESPVGIAPLPTPHPRPDESSELIGWILEPTVQPRPEARVERVGIAPLPTPHPRPDAVVERVGLVSGPASFRW